MDIYIYNGYIYIMDIYIYALSMYTYIYIYLNETDCRLRIFNQIDHLAMKRG